jgi:purine catabolism regulator
LKDDFVWGLAKEEIESWETLYSRAKSLDYNISLPYVCILGAPEQLETLYKNDKRPQKSFEHWKQKTIRLIEEQIVLTGNSVQLNIMSTFQREWFIIFLEIPINDISPCIKNYLDLLEKNLQPIFSDLIISWGIGENDAGIRKFHESFNKARIALEVGRKQKGPGNRSTYTNTSLYRTLLSLSNNTEIQEITLSVIGPLIDYDNQRGLDLVNTLIIYIRNQGNVSQTSRVMNLHRQSLLYRLRKIESLTERSLVDPDDLFLLDLSIKLWTSGIMDERGN